MDNLIDNLFNTEAFDTINKGDSVVIIGKDHLKGLYGIIVAMNSHANLPDCVFSVELEATGEIVQRKKINLKRHFSLTN